MDIEFASDDLRKLATDTDEKGGFDAAIVKAFRKAIQVIAAAPDERTLRAYRSFRFKQLKGQRKGEWSIRLNRQWRLIVEIVPGESGNTIRVLGVEDYH